MYVNVNISIEDAVNAMRKDSEGKKDSPITTQYTKNPDKPLNSSISPTLVLLASGSSLIAQILYILKTTVIIKMATDIYIEYKLNFNIPANSGIETRDRSI